MLDDSSRIDTLLGELQYRHRRQVLTFFEESDANRAHIDELVEFIGDRDSNTSDPDSLAATLHHATLPALADTGFIDYDREEHTVRYREKPRVQRALSLLAELRDDT